MFVLNTLEYKRLIRMRDLGLICSENLSEQAIKLTLALASSLSVLFDLARQQMGMAHRGVALARAEREARDALDLEAYAVAVAEYKEGVRLCTELSKSIVQTMSDATALASALNVAVHQSLRNDPTTVAKWDRTCQLAINEPMHRAARKPSIVVVAA